MTTAETRFHTTGIGSLPHHNVDAALEFSFQMSIPFLPQIPIRNPWEFMIAQALEGLPGLQVEKEGSVVLNTEVWMGRSRAFNDRLLSAFSGAAKADAFEAFEPSSATSSSWQPFLWELEERGIRTAKIQLAGPMTAQWAIRTQDGSNVDRHPEITTQIYRLVLARAIAMSRRIQSVGIQPMLYLDEPGLYGLTVSNPKHALGIQELKLLIQALKKENVQVGLHCCSNTDWDSVLSLGLNILSIDTGLSLTQLLSHTQAVDAFLKNGGRLSLGVIPTSKPTGGFYSLDARELHQELESRISEKTSQDLGQRILQSSILTPACGLALHSTSDAEMILATLREFQQYCLRSA